MTSIAVKKIRSVDEYLTVLTQAKKSPVTIRDYRYILNDYARFTGVALPDLHTHLNPDDLMGYADHMSGSAPVTRKKFIGTVARFMKINGVAFDELERGVITSSEPEEKEDLPLTLDLAQKMMDLGTPHTRALIAFMCSTGARAGETSQLLLSDVGKIEHGKFVPDITGSVVNIRNKIAKRGKGGMVFLTREAREFLTLWLKDREQYIRLADVKSKNLRKGDTGREKGAKHTGAPITRPQNDQRLFAVSYYTLAKLFRVLYGKVDGRKDKYGRGAVVPHRCRAFFRTNASKMGVDLVEGILRHSGYLNAQYVRMTPEERYKQFHAGEAALYITRKDHRIQTGELADLKRANEELTKDVAQLRDLLEVHESPAPVMRAIVPKNLPPEQAAAINAAIKNLNDVLASVAQ
jgi:integrase